MTADTNDPQARKLLRCRDAADYLAICERTLFSLTRPRGPIPRVTIGRAVRYDVADLDEYIEAQREAG